MRTLLFSGCVLVLSGCSGSMDQTLDTLSTGFAERFGVREIEVEDLNSFSADLIVDVRTAEEQSISMIPGAVAVRPDSDLSGLSEFANARRIVVYCAAGYRSARAIAALPSDRRGAREIYSLRGGIISYANAGRPLAGTSEQKVHGYNAAWAVFVRAPARAVLEPVPGGRP